MGDFEKAVINTWKLIPYFYTYKLRMMVHGQTLTAGPNAKSWEFPLLTFKIKFYEFKVVIIIWEAAHYSMLHALEKLLNPDLQLPSNLLFHCFIMELMISMIFSWAYKNTDQDKVSSVLLPIKNNISDKIALLFPDISGMFNHRSSTWLPSTATTARWQLVPRTWR